MSRVLLEGRHSLIRRIIGDKKRRGALLASPPLITYSVYFTRSIAGGRKKSLLSS